MLQTVERQEGTKERYLVHDGMSQLLQMHQGKGSRHGAPAISQLAWGWVKEGARTIRIGSL